MLQSIVYTVLLINIGFSTTDNILKDIETTHTFIGDDLLAGIIPNISDSWDSVKTGISGSEGNKTEPEKQSFWEGILQKFKPYHVAIRNVDRLVLENSPSYTLDPIVNISIGQLKELTEKVEKHDNTLEWLDSVKESWTRISSLTSQIHWKYNWVFDHIFVEEESPYAKDDLHEILNETLHLYHAWYRVPDRGDDEEQRTLDLNELSEFSKTVAAASGEPKNMFRGLRDLLRKGSAAASASDADNATNPCTGNETFAGEKGVVNKAIPVYVLLHLLNSEFKYFLMRNIAAMYNCIHHGVCHFETRETTMEHLNLYYQFYYSGIVEAFNDNSEEEALTTKIPESIWRWRCDPPIVIEETPTPEHPPRRDHKENVTFTRLYDFATAFIADERNLSLTQTCRESCDMFDGAYSSIPCEEDDWNCLEAEKYFDCSERLMTGLACPARARTICPNDGLLCHTTPIVQANMCKVQKSKRFIEWIESDVDDMKIMGKKTECNTEDLVNLVMNEQVERSAITKYEPQKCEVCLCTCYEPLGEDTHRYISLIPQEADTANGYILVGTKFTKVDKVIHVLIAEAKLVNGEVDPATIRWKEASTVNITDSTQVFRVGKQAKRILLDDLIAPIGHVVTGVRLTARPVPRPEDYKIDSNLVLDAIYHSKADNESLTWHYGFEDSELAFEVRTTPIDKDGFLKPEESNWISNANSSKARTEVSLHDPDEPTLSVNASLPASFPNEFIVIQSSSMSKDAGQTPVPFFDAQELLENQNLGPIRALGLFYKGLPGYGGFFAFRQVSVPWNDSPKIPGFDLWGSLKDKKNKKEK